MKPIHDNLKAVRKMAVEEGWYSKDGSKWLGEMRFQMLQYRYMQKSAEPVATTAAAEP